MILVCPIHTNKELTKLGSCVSCRKRVQGIPKPEPVPNPAQVTVAVDPEPEPTPAPSAAAIRAAKWREKRKQQDPDFNKKQAERKQTERKQAEREQQLQQALDSGEFPRSVSALRFKNAPRLFLTDAPQGVGLITTGGYDREKIDKVTAKHLRTLGGLYQGVSLARPNRPEGTGPDTELPPKVEQPSRYVYVPDKAVRTMRNFIRNFTDTRSTDGKSTMVCLRCEEQLSPDFSFAAGFNHLYDKHPEQFEIMMEWVASAQSKHGCAEDHEGMAQRHGGGTRKLYCGKCKKLLYKPPKPGRSDRPKKQPKTFKLLITHGDTPQQAFGLL